MVLLGLFVPWLPTSFLAERKPPLIASQPKPAYGPGNLPSITRVIDAIQRKKTRDNAIIGLVIAACICFTIWYL